MIYLYDRDGFFVSVVEDTIAFCPDSTTMPPDLDKVKSENWEVKFDREKGVWTYTDITPEPEQATFDILTPSADGECQNQCEGECQKQREEENKAYINNLANELHDPLLAKFLESPKLKKLIKKLAKDANKSI